MSRPKVADVESWEIAQHLSAAARRPRTTMDENRERTAPHS
jgi:hypothetical protein